MMTSFLKKLHCDRRGNLLAISAVFVAALVMVLTVVINLAHVTHEKIRAQNAADAAALAGGVWQVQGLGFVQSINNLVYMSDMLASFGLNVAVAGSAASATGFGALVGQPIGNAGLVVCMGAHGFSQFVLVPMRDFMNASWPLVCAVGASEMAKSNQARPVIASFDDMLSGVMLEAVERGTGIHVDLSSLTDNSFGKAGTGLWGKVRDLKVYAIGMEMEIDPDAMESLQNVLSLFTDFNKERVDLVLETVNNPVEPGKVSLVGLHLERVTEGATGWPLVIPDVVVDVQLAFCSALPVAPAARSYFMWAQKFQLGLDSFVEKVTELSNLGSSDQEKTIDVATGKATENASRYPGSGVSTSEKKLCTKWNHPFYREGEHQDPENEKMVRLPASTWFAGAGASDAEYRRRTALWENIMGGLGVPKGKDRRYGQLGSVACSSIQVRADKVGKYPKTIRGWVNLVPVHIVENKDDSLELGICH